MEGTVWERERLVADGGEGKGKERRGGRYLSQVGGGWGERKREWKGAQRLVNGRFKTGAPSSRPEER